MLPFLIAVLKLNPRAIWQLKGGVIWCTWQPVDVCVSAYTQRMFQHVRCHRGIHSIWMPVVSVTDCSLSFSASTTSSLHITWNGQVTTSRTIHAFAGIYTIATGLLGRLIEYRVWPVRPTEPYFWQRIESLSGATLWQKVSPSTKEWFLNGLNSWRQSRRPRET